jgi:uncharacterized protein
MYYILFYYYIEDYLDRREAYRSEHLANAKIFHKKGELISAGALGNPAKDAMMIFKCDPSIIEKFVENDPYFKNGLIVNWEIRPWNVVIGSVK